MKKLFIILFLLSNSCFGQNPASGGYLLAKANGAVSIGTEVNTAPLTVTNFATTFPNPQAGTILHIVSDAVTNGRISSDTYNNSSITGPNYQGRRARGTAASPLPPNADDVLVALGADGYGDNSFTGVSVGSMNIRADATFSNTSKPTYISFTTTPSGSITQVERVRIKPDGTFQVTGLNAAGFVQTDANGNFSTGTNGSTLTSLNASNLATGTVGTARLGSGTANSSTFLRGDGTWAAPSGSGTVTDFIFTNGGGFTGSVSTSTTTPTLSLTLQNAAADGSTKGQASFTAADFDASSGNIGIDYTNGQAASGSAKGFLTSADWTTFNNKLATNGNGSSLTGITATQVGATTVGANIFGLTNPSATGYIRTNADNTVTHRSYANVKVDLSLDNVPNESKATMFTSPTFTGEVSLPAATTTTSPANVPSGTLETTPEAGDVLEYDGNAMYATTDAGNRGVLSVNNFIRLDASYNLSNSAAEQQLFNTTANGRLTLETGTYFFECVLSISGMSATSGNAAFDILGAGSSTVGTVLYHIVGVDGNANTAATQTGSTSTSAQSPASMVTAGTGTVLNASLRGTFEITAAGTIQPAVTLVTASAATVAAGTYFRCRRIGSTTAGSVGQWD